MPTEILTIGHSTHSWTRFAQMLQEYRISIVADVRSSPYSRICPHFNQEELARALAHMRMEYMFFGQELGGRVDDPACYVNRRIQYGRVAQRRNFQAALQRLVDAGSSRRLVVMCAEGEPIECHRTLLLGRVLERQGVRVGHILAHGGEEDHVATMERLLRLAGLSQEDLFLSRDERIEAACAAQEDRVAYRQETRATATEGT